MIRTKYSELHRACLSPLPKGVCTLCRGPLNAPPSRLFCVDCLRTMPRPVGGYGLEPWFLRIFGEVSSDDDSIEAEWIQEEVPR